MKEKGRDGEDYKCMNKYEKLMAKTEEKGNDQKSSEKNRENYLFVADTRTSTMLNRFAFV